jgi:Glycerol-3-phosphate dehydrogenase
MTSGERNPDGNDSREFGPVAILGSGDWGSTLAWLLCCNEDISEVRLWGRNEAKIAQMRKSGDFGLREPLAVPEKLILEVDLAAAISGARLIVMACSSQAMRELANQVNSALLLRMSDDKPVIVNVAKGLELNTFMRMSEVIESEISNVTVMTMSGPNLAFEIRKSQPCATTVAGKNPDALRYAQKCLRTSLFRVYTNEDLVGVELGGTLKNVIAIAAGGTDGLDLGVNAKAALLTRGLAEMTRFAVKFGAKESTLFGLSGVGDLMATCQGPLSRNYRVGYYLAKGKSLEMVLEMIQSVAEGVNTTFAVCDLAKKMGVELPIAEQVAKILRNEMSPEKSIPALMGRRLVNE